MKTVKRRLKDGTVKVYRYRQKKPEAATLGALIQEYRQSAEFDALRPGSQRNYLRAMGKMEPLYRAPVRDIKRRHVIKLRDAYRATPGMASLIVSTFSVLMNYAVAMEYREGNPAWRIRPLPMGEHRGWTQAQVAYAVANMPQPLARAVVVAVYTGQRLGDLIRMTWADFDGEGIHVTQQKTGARLWVACHRDLREALLEWRSEDRPATTILVSQTGRPWAPGSLSTAFSAEVRRHSELSGCRFHGLRKTAAANLAEAGCTTGEIGAITGHRSLQMLAYYTRSASQETMARAAILKLENFREKKETKAALKD